MSSRTERWQIVFFKRHPEDDPSERRPGVDFLDSCPLAIRARLIAFVDAVAAGPPPQFRGGAIWQAMHDEMAGYYEVRARGGARLYRLFCLLELPRPGLSQPSIVILGGMWKPNNATFTAAEYASVRALGDEYRRRSPRSIERFA